MGLGLENYRVIPIEIDTVNDVIFPIVLSCGDNDGRIIRVSVTDGGNPVQLDLTARLVYNPRPLIKDSAGGYVTMTAVAGTDTATWEACIPGTSLVPGAALMAFQLMDGDSILLSRVFECTCEPLIVHEDAPEVKSALSEFWAAVSEITDAEETAKTAAEIAEKAAAEAEGVITEANAAADAANTAAASANDAADAANAAADEANSAASAANATNDAVAAAEAERADEWASMSLTIGDVITGQEGSDAYALIRSDGSRLELKLDLTIPRGDTGTSVTILGEYDTLADLEAAVPVGELGWGFLLANGDLCVWNGTEWQDVGNIRGPVGLTPDITFSASVDSAKCTESGMPRVDVTQTGTDENPYVALDFHGLVGEDGEPFAWNILRNTNAEVTLDSNYRTTEGWDAGKWTRINDGTSTQFEVTDAPVADIVHGWHLESDARVVNYIEQTKVGIRIGQTVIMSCYARIMDGYDSGELRFRIGNLNGTQAQGTYALTNEWQQISRVFTLLETYAYDNDGGTRIDYGPSLDSACDICGMKLELAQNADNPRATQWTPSVWDVTPQLSMSATADALSSDEPTVTVTQDTSGNATAFDLAFSGLKGAKGDKGEDAPDHSEDVEYNLEATAHTYPGRDLTAVFADEIAGYANAWAWLQARTKAADYTGLRIADYIPITLSTGESVNYCIGAIDPYYNTGDTGYNKGHHIAMVPNKTIQNCEGTYATGSGLVQWNTTNNNNGTEAEPHPYLCSNLHAWELNDYYNQLPSEVRAVIMDNRMYLEERYSSAGTLTDPTAGSWADMGPVWSLSEVEVYGFPVRSYAYYSAGVCCQFPYFAMASERARNGRYNTWLRDPRSGTSTGACGVNTSGYAYSNNTSGEYRARPCFLVG